MRTIPIPDRAQVEKVTATLESEILTVLLPVPSSRPSHRLSARVWADLKRVATLN
jgi:HSP20 family molecular chaperone IbpA